jgi:hypothetical protein
MSHHCSQFTRALSKEENMSDYWFSST